MTTSTTAALNANSFAESNIRVTRNDANGNPVLSNAQPITEFSNTGGEFTFPNTAADPLFGTPADTDGHTAGTVPVPV